MSRQKNIRFKKHSLTERISFFGKKMSSSKKNEAAFAEGYIDSATSSKINGSQFKTESERRAYFNGVDKGNKALYKSRNIKF